MKMYFISFSSLMPSKSRGSLSRASTNIRPSSLSQLAVGINWQWKIDQDDAIENAIANGAVTLGGDMRADSPGNK